MYWKEYQEAGEEALLVGNYEDAKRHFKCALKETEASSAHTRERAITCTSLGEILIFEGLLAKAESRLKEAINLLASGNERLDKALALLGQLYVQRKEFARAKPLLERYLSLRSGAESDGPRLTAESNLAKCFQHEHKIEVAERSLRHVLIEREKLLGQDHPGLVDDLKSLADCLLASGKHADAEVLYFRALDLLDALKTPDPRCIAMIEGLIESYMGSGKTQAAHDLCVRMLDRWKAHGKGESAAAVLLSGHAARLNALMRVPDQPLREFELDEYYFERQLAIENATDDVSYLEWLEAAAANLDRAKQHDKAKLLHEKARTLAEKVYGEQHPRTARILRGLADNANARGDHELTSRLSSLVSKIDAATGISSAPSPQSTLPSRASEGSADYHDLMARVMAEHGLVDSAVQYESKADKLRDQEES